MSDPVHDPAACWEPGHGDRLPAALHSRPVLGPAADVAAVVMPGGGPRGLLGAFHGSAGGGASDQVDLGAVLATLYGVEVDGVALDEGLKDHVDEERPSVEKAADSAGPVGPLPEPGGGEDLVELPPFDGLVA